MTTETLDALRDLRDATARLAEEGVPATWDIATWSLNLGNDDASEEAHELLSDAMRNLQGIVSAYLDAFDGNLVGGWKPAERIDL